MSAEPTARKKAMNPLEKAQRNPKSRASALRGYYYDWVGLSHPSNDPRAGLREEYKSLVRRTRGKLSATIKDICFDCVGGNADPGPKIRVRDCAITDCLLRGVRPWQSIRGRRPETAGEAFSGAESDGDDSGPVSAQA